MSGCSHGYGCHCGGWVPPPYHPHHHHHHGCGCGCQPYVPLFSWVPAKNGYIPPNSVVSGNDTGGSLLYVGRAYHEGDLIPGKVAPAHSSAFVAWGGREHRKHDYEVLVSNHRVMWVHESNGRVPPNAVVGGNTKSGETLYIGRTHHMSSITPGKVQPSHHCLYISYGDKEISKSNYEVLVITNY